ncbi:MAG: DUF5615 family PIN-like protein [Balneolaceae bacterium]|nr:DUF5615 family PIN-like protein [Balneolaceae bacterium]
MKFFADHCVPSSVITKLQNKGHEVLVLKDYLPADAQDSLVIEKAGQLGSLLISLNRDFSDITRYFLSDYDGIIALQIRYRPEAISAILDRLFHFIRFHPAPTFFKVKLGLDEPHWIRIRQ